MVDVFLSECIHDAQAGVLFLIPHALLTCPSRLFDLFDTGFSSFHQLFVLLPEEHRLFTGSCGKGVVISGIQTLIANHLDLYVSWSHKEKSDPTK